MFLFRLITSAAIMATKKKKKTKAKPNASASQWVYIMSNASMPGLVKIGMTTTSPQQRNEELGSATGVPTPFTLEYFVKVRNALEAEQAIHRDLAAYRVNRRREFFEIDLKSAIRAVNSVAKHRRLDKHPARLLLRYVVQAVSALAFLYLGYVGLQMGLGPVLLDLVATLLH